MIEKCIYTTEYKCLYSNYIILYNMSKTTIQVESTTLNRLKTIKVTRRESYDEIINRLIDGGKQNVRKHN